MSSDDTAQTDALRARLRSAKRHTSSHYKANNEGGFGNPPVAHQFKPGGRGGPGRPAGISTLEGEMARMLKGKVPLKNGGQAEYTKALAMAARDASLGKTVAATEFGFKLFERFGPNTEEVKYDLSRFSDDELRLFLPFINRLLRPDDSVDGAIRDGSLEAQYEPAEGIYRVERKPDGGLAFKRIASLDDDPLAARRDEKPAGSDLAAFGT